METLYIAGPMRGSDIWNYDRFFYWDVVLRKLGYDVVNPAREDVMKWVRDGWVFTPEQFDAVLEEDLSLIEKRCTGIFLLKGWEESVGARAEMAKAEALGLTIYGEGVDFCEHS